MNEGRREGTKLVFDSSKIDSRALFRLVLASYRAIGLPETFYLNGVGVTASKLETIIAEKRSWPSGVVSNGVNFLSGILPARRINFLDLKDSDFLVEMPTLSLSKRLTAGTGFIHGWVYDIEYDFWQNARDPLEYERLGRSAANLPKRSNGLPAPLNQLEIDTSLNPGRTELKVGYIEAVGRLMWIADRFWSIVGTEKISSCALLRQQGFQVSDSDGIVQVSAEKRFFDVSSGERQQTLRRILFGSNSKQNSV
ncbi:hypothetical protein LMG26685_05385 [Achromobacter mucicolens]|uniref:hypothetical protein n=1 Tax=Achromobacter mucicolens TaxID=1389922 RepID=UPI0010080C5B|nr:hypothetical protein [Achromobacter mucicolens]CAB3702658.1 hypothetical protein LMG26685_05385 [Achromobacter mucicolens]